MEGQEQSESFSVDENVALMLLGIGGLIHAVVWLALRDPTDIQDPFVGAEGLAVIALLFIVVGVVRRRRSRS